MLSCQFLTNSEFKVTLTKPFPCCLLLMTGPEETLVPPLKNKFVITRCARMQCLRFLPASIPRCLFHSSLQSVYVELEDVSCPPPIHHHMGNFRLELHSRIFWAVGTHCSRSWNWQPSSVYESIITLKFMILRTRPRPEIFLVFCFMGREIMKPAG